MIGGIEWHTVYSFFGNFLAASWNIFESSSVYMLFGFFTAGILYIAIRKEKIGALLGRGRIQPVFLSALIGVPLPLCSCGVIPAAAGLRKQGASKGATISFLISTPESGIDSISVTYALLDPIMTIVRPVSAFLTAMTAGMVENIFGKKNSPVAGNPVACGCSSGNCATKPGIQNIADAMPLHPSSFKTVRLRLSSGLSYAFVDLLGDVGKWFVIGILIAGGITLLIPDSLLASVSENRMIAMLLAMVAGIPMYVCATASTPIAAALILKGLNPGAALVFLLLGPATNITSLSMVYGLLGKRSLAIYLGSMIGCAFLFGFLVDSLYAMLQIVPTAVVGHASEIMPAGIEIVASILLGVLLVYSIAKPYFTRSDKTASPNCATCSDGCL